MTLFSVGVLMMRWGICNCRRLVRLVVVVFCSYRVFFFLHAGNADGMGNIRKDELYRACAILKVVMVMKLHLICELVFAFHYVVTILTLNGHRVCNPFVQVPLHQVKILDHPDFQVLCSPLGSAGFLFRFN